jgi:hypothetical protein
VARGTVDAHTRTRGRMDKDVVPLSFRAAGDCGIKVTETDGAGSGLVISTVLAGRCN